MSSTPFDGRDPRLPSKKNPCPDCTFCQCCSETRCSLCKSIEPGNRKKHCRKEQKPLFRLY